MQKPNEPKDLFAFGINYNTVTENASRASALYNGNISETFWKTANDDTKRSYSYQYDALNRLTAGYASSGNYNLLDVSYDKVGNIMSLTRNGWQGGSTFANMDVLDYQYANSGMSNKLMKVTDTGNIGHGFKDGNTVGDDYVYDPNGNLIQDLNKDIKAPASGGQGIEYNHLNLPTKVNVDGTDSGTIDFVYDACGAKLWKIKTEGGNTMVTDYVSGYVYENGDLVQFSHPEGYVEPESDGYRYFYNYLDHLGTVRLVYSDYNNDGDIDVTNDPLTTEIVMERNTYPFGLSHRGYNESINGRENNYQTYLGQEINKELGLDWLTFRYRNYIPEIGRFFGVDSITEQFPNQTPYQFASNNPVWKIELEGLEGFPTTEEDYINGFGYGVDPGDGSAVPVSANGPIKQFFTMLRMLLLVLSEVFLVLYMME